MKLSTSHGLAAVALLMAALPLLSQDPRGTVLGRVSDATGALVPNAEIRILNENTGVSSSARTNNSGNFVLPYLLSGTYTISCEIYGLKKRRLWQAAGWCLSLRQFQWLIRLAVPH